MDSKELLQQKQRLMQLGASGQIEAALELAEQLSARAPEDMELGYALAQLQEQKGMVEPALQSYMRVVSRPSPVIRQALGRLVDLCLAHGYEKLALEPARHLARANDQSARAQFQMALCLLAIDHLMEAKEYLLRAVSLDGNSAPALFRLADVCLNLGEVREAIAYFKRFSDANGTPEAAEHWCLNYLSGVSEQEIFEAHRRFAQTIESSAEPATIKASPPAGRSLRIGLISKDFCSHSVAWFIKPMMRNREACDWHLTCYSTGQKKDGVTAELKTLCDSWRDVASVSNASLSEQIRSDRIDVLIDLVGYAGDARLSVFAHRVSPVQVTYLGYPNTTGLAQMDYRFTDDWSDPEGMTDAYYTEDLVRLPGGFLCFEPHAEAPVVAPRKHVSSGSVVFGSFNVHHKISSEIFDCWAEVLKAVPGSHMLFKSRPLAEPRFCDAFLERFEARGIDRSRLRLLGHTAGKAEHLALYNEVDINLDTYPYNGTTTTCEALWQGVPTLTLAGEGHRARVGCSILNQVGLQDWVASSVEEYIALAVDKTRDLNALTMLREGLRNRMRQSSLLDGKRMVTEMDQAFRNMVQAASDG